MVKKKEQLAELIDLGVEENHGFDDVDLPVAKSPEPVAPAIILKPEPGTIKHLFHQELDEQPDEVDMGTPVIPIRGDLRKEIWNGDVEVLILPEDLIREWERNPNTFEQNLKTKLREHGFSKCQVVDNEVLQPNPRKPGEYVVVKKR